jgi:hypothetical protein
MSKVSWGSRLFKWIIRQRGQMYHRLEALKIRICEITSVSADLWNPRGDDFPELAADKQIGVPNLQLHGQQNTKGPARAPI